MIGIQDAATAYGTYFSAFSRASTLLSPLSDILFSGIRKELMEEAFSDTLARLSHTGQTLHYKYAFSHASLSGDSLSIHSNGFPNKSEIDGMLIDMVALEQNQGELASVEALKQAWLAQVLKTGVDDPDILWRLGERRYLECLDKDKIILPIIAGTLHTLGEANQDEMKYAFWWSSYSSSCNAPVVHILEFTQDIVEEVEALSKKGSSLVNFLQVIHKIGNRTPPVNVLAHDIDHALPYIHPKRLTRIQFDRLFASTLRHNPEDPLDEDIAATNYFNELAESDEVLLRFSIDEAISKGTKKPDGKAFGRKQSQEIFDFGVEEKAHNRGASTSEELILVPHRLVQILHSDKKDEVEALFYMIDRVIAYSKGGQVNAI